MKCPICGGPLMGDRFDHKPWCNGQLQVAWRSKATGEVCDCPVFETSPHANSEPVYVEVTTTTEANRG